MTKGGQARLSVPLAPLISAPRHQHARCRSPAATVSDPWHGSRHLRLQPHEATDLPIMRPQTPPHETNPMSFALLSQFLAPAAAWLRIWASKRWGEPPPGLGFGLLNAGGSRRMAADLGP
jgi:hypothetical protein